MSETYSNHAGTTLSAAITSTSRPVTFTVASATGLPSSGNFRVIIDSEILLITSISGMTLTGSNVEDSLATTHSSGATVQHILTAGAIDQIRSDQVQTGALSSATSTHTGNLYLPSDGISIARDTGSGFTHFGPIWPNVQVPSTGWSWDNQSTAVLTSAHGIESISLSGNTPGIAYRYRTAPAPPYTFSALLVRDFPLASGAYDVRGGIAVREASTGKIIMMNGGPCQGSAGNVPYMAVSKYTTSTTWSADYYLNLSADWYQFIYATHVWYHITDDGTNLSFGYSYDGWNSRVIITKPRTDFLTSGPSQIAFFAGSSSNLSRPLVVSLIGFRAA